MQQTQQSQSGPQNLVFIKENYVTAETFLPENLLVFPPEQKQIPAKQGEKSPGDYYELSYKYNFGSKEQPKIDDLVIGFSEVETLYGINNSTLNGKQTYSLAIPVDKEGKDKKIADMFEKIFEISSHTIDRYKVPLKLEEYDPVRPGGAFRRIVLPRKNKQTGETLPGPHNLWVKLSPYASASKPKAVFSHLNKTVIPWEQLYGTRIKHKPRVLLRCIYSGAGKCRMQPFLKESTVVYAFPSEGQSGQEEEIDQYNRENPEAAAALAANLALIALGKKEKETTAPAAGGNNAAAGMVSAPPTGYGVPSAPPTGGFPYSTVQPNFGNITIPQPTYPGPIGVIQGAPPTPSNAGLASFVGGAPSIGGSTINF